MMIGQTMRKKNTGNPSPATRDSRGSSATTRVVRGHHGDGSISAE